MTMEPIVPTPETAEAETRLEWLLSKLHAESLRRGTRLRMPVLVGGTALRRAWRLTRPSTDLDFAVASEREMDTILRAVTRIARERWPNAKVRLREDGEEGWRIDNEHGQAMLHIGGLTMGEASLGLAHWRRETWTLPIGRLATMKIEAGVELRSKARDLYDMGFLAEHYPGDITTEQAEQVRGAGWEATESPNRWRADYERDHTLQGRSLKKIGQDAARAAGEALVHIEGARQRRWVNQGSAAAALEETVLQEPLGTWETHVAGERVDCTWRARNGQVAWQARMENERRVRALLRQADLDGHPHVRRPAHGPAQKPGDPHTR